MDYEKEIPFGAFDSELMHQEISIPEGFEATIERDKIILTRTECEDEKIRKWCISHFRECFRVTKNNVEYQEYLNNKIIPWLEKQKPIQNINKEDEEVRQYIVRIMEQRDINVPMVQKALAWLENQGKSDKIVEKAKIEKQRVLVTESDGSANIDWDTRSLKDAITLLKHGLNYLQKIEVKKQIMPNSRFGGCSECIPTRFDKEKQGEQKPADKNEPKFKVKYAGNEYNVLDVKENMGITWYGIEDEPNHIDYIKADSCEIVSGYAIKENGSSYPTKPAMFSEQKPAWSEEDESWFKELELMALSFSNDVSYLKKFFDWLKSLKDRVQPQNLWKPSLAQMNAISIVSKGNAPDDMEAIVSLYNDLKKLKGE